ncbi:hypothetical protein J6590_023175 [Homalodisca vitripennis]|nr:hypothetical protein J6590_023175 [Homalodisca vitripennis]
MTELNDADVHVGGFILDIGPDVVIASPKPLYLDYDSNIILATPEPCSRVIIPTTRIPQQAHVASERIPSQLNILVYNSEPVGTGHAQAGTTTVQRRGPLPHRVHNWGTSLDPEVLLTAVPPCAGHLTSVYLNPIIGCTRISH